MLTALLFYRLARLDVPSKGVVNDWNMALFSMLICDARSRADKHSDVASWQKLGRSLHASNGAFPGALSGDVLATRVQMAMF